MADSDGTPRLTRVYPPPSGAERIAARSAYAHIDFGALAPSDRPYLIVNMVATADGHGRIGADTERLGDAADAALFATLRERVDCVMAGTGTIGVEQYNAPARQPETQQRRRDSGLAARPIVATITRSGRLPLTAPLFADPELRVAVFSDTAPETGSAAAAVEHIATTDPEQVLAALRRDFGVRSLLLEGGPTLNTAFFAAGLVDELFLTLAPVLIGNADPFPIIAGALPAPRGLHLLGALSGDEHLFLRYRVR